jgi:hypothetical protein
MGRMDSRDVEKGGNGKRHCPARHWGTANRQYELRASQKLSSTWQTDLTGDLERKRVEQMEGGESD